MKRIPEPEYMDDQHEADAYAHTDFSGVNTAFTQRMLGHAPASERTWAIDLGCGPGDITLRVAAAQPAWRVVGADAATAMLIHAQREARQRGLTRQAGWTLCDGKRTPFARAAFGVVFSNSILHHLPDPAPFWEEVKRIAAPGAYVFLCDLYRPDSPGAARALVEKHAEGATDLLKEEFYRSFLSAFTPQEIRAQLRAAHLTGLHVETVTDRHVDIRGVIQ